MRLPCLGPTGDGVVEATLLVPLLFEVNAYVMPASARIVMSAAATISSARAGSLRPGRALTVHLKEYSATNERALIGEGDVRWPEIFTLCERDGGTEWYIVEQESYAYPPLECVDRCLQKLREMGK